MTFLLSRVLPVVGVIALAWFLVKGFGDAKYAAGYAAGSAKVQADDQAAWDTQQKERARESARMEQAHAKELARLRAAVAAAPLGAVRVCFASPAPAHTGQVPGAEAASPAGGGLPARDDSLPHPGPDLGGALTVFAERMGRIIAGCRNR